MFMDRVLFFIIIIVITIIVIIAVLFFIKVRLFMDGVSMYVLISSRLGCLWLRLLFLCIFFGLFGVRNWISFKSGADD